MTSTTETDKVRKELSRAINRVFNASAADDAVIKEEDAMAWIKSTRIFIKSLPAPAVPVKAAKKKLAAVK